MQRLETLSISIGRLNPSSEDENAKENNAGDAVNGGIVVSVPATNAEATPDAPVRNGHAAVNVPAAAAAKIDADVEAGEPVAS